MNAYTENNGLVLDNCPFCGKADTFPVYDSNTNSHFIRCEFCEATGPVAITLDESVDAWNSRAAHAEAGEPEKEQLNEALRESWEKLSKITRAINHET